MFPAKFKEALIRSLLKKQNLDPEKLKNYKPVSNLYFISNNNRENCITTSGGTYQHALPVLIEKQIQTTTQQSQQPLLRS